MERLKQTMVNQELVFMRQVYELHRLYRIQLAMKEDFKQNGFGFCDLHKGGVGSISMVEFMASESSKMQHVLSHRLPRFVQKHFDLQLPADEFIRHSENDFSWEGFVRDSLKEAIESKNSALVEVVSDVDLNLSLRVRQEARKYGGEHRSWTGKKAFVPSDAIDIRDTNLCFPNTNSSLGLTSCFTAVDTFSRAKSKLERFSQSGMRAISYGNIVRRSLTDVIPSCQKPIPSSSGFNEHQREFSDAFASKNQNSGTCKANHLDLNEAYLDDSSYCLSDGSDKVHPESTIASVSPASWRKENVNHFTETSDIHRPKNIVNLDSVVTCKGNYRENRTIVDKFREDLDCDSGEELSNPKIDSVGSSSKLSNGLPRDPDVDAVRAEANIEDGKPFIPSYSCQNQISVGHPNCHKLSSSCESNCIIDRQSRPKTMHFGVTFADPNASTDDESQKANMVVDTESNVPCTDRKEREVDEMVQNAAELLVQMSVETRACYKGGLIKDDQPECSSESYEAMVLKTKESDPDDYCISSNAFVVDESEKKGCGYKLKRGTRMKDFKKDILPGLSTLFRHEIREDINIMEGVIRSREYKRMRAKMGGGGDWCRPTRSKRSRVSYSSRCNL